MSQDGARLQTDSIYQSENMDSSQLQKVRDDLDRSNKELLAVLSDGKRSRDKNDHRT